MKFYNFRNNKNCKCYIDISSTSSSQRISPTDDSYKSRHTILLGKDYTNNIGLNTLTFTIYDINSNYYKFKYDISVDILVSR